MIRAKRFLPLLLALCAEAAGGELTPFIQESQIGALIVDARAPKSLPKDLMSGLTNTILVRMSLLEGPTVVRRQTAEVAIKYDLWDEVFTATLAVNGAGVSTHRARTLDDITSFIARLELPRLFHARELTGSTRYVLHADVLFNPIDRERMKIIKKWVHENSTYAPIGPEAIGARAPMANDIFNRLFEQYAKDTDETSASRESLSSAPFTLEVLRDARR